VIGQEYGEDRPTRRFVWVLDPVDGTRAFIAGLPLWTTLIGLRFQGRPCWARSARSRRALSARGAARG
jgi:fructose-1,6-bisphosphatase/inositol monophosphatase family enzyme